MTTSIPGTFCKPSDRAQAGSVRDLSRFNNDDFDVGRGPIVRALWYLTCATVFNSYLFPVYALKRMLLRTFGAQIGAGVVVKPRVRIKYPWKLVVGRQAWIGEDVWIDNLEKVCIGENVCISQGVYLCTGSHDRRKPTFDLITRPIVVRDGAWICAKSIVLPGVVLGIDSVVAAGSVVISDVDPGVFVSGNPAMAVNVRVP